MGLTGSHWEARHDGLQIEVKSAAGLVNNRASLYVNGVKVDAQTYLVGETFLKGTADAGGVGHRIVAIIDQGWLTTECRLLVDDREVPFHRLR